MIFTKPIFDMSFSISLNHKPSVPLSNFANLANPVVEINENRINRIIATTKVTVNALVNVPIVDLGIAAVIMVRLIKSLRLGTALCLQLLQNQGRFRQLRKL